MTDLMKNVREVRSLMDTKMYPGSSDLAVGETRAKMAIELEKVKQLTRIADALERIDVQTR